MIGRFLRWLFRIKEPCQHLRYREDRWLSADGTPMVHFQCKDCGYSSGGHVHGDSDNWAGTTET